MTDLAQQRRRMAERLARAAFDAEFTTAEAEEFLREAMALAVEAERERLREAVGKVQSSLCKDCVLSLLSPGGQP